MAKYKVSIGVVRKANKSMENRVTSRNTEGFSRGDITVRFETSAASKRLNLTNQQIKVAYKKAVDITNAKTI